MFLNNKKINKLYRYKFEYPIKALHIFGSMQRGGAETWIMHILRNIDRSKIKIDFLVHNPQKALFDDEIKSLGSKLIYCADVRNPYKYARNFKKILHDHGPYKIVHSNVHHYSGYILYLAHKFDIPIRIAHSHSDISSLQKSANLLRKGYYSLTEKLIAYYATKGLAGSERAANSLFGDTWRENSKYELLFTGIDLNPFMETIDRQKIRNKLGIPKNAFIIGHVGRFIPAKNQTFLIDILEVIQKYDNDIYLLMMGSGPLKDQILKKVVLKNLQKKVFSPNTSENVRDIMKGAVDIFVMPSTYEGLPIVGIEAQASGLHCLLSDRISDEICIVNPLINILSLNGGPHLWANKIIEFKNQKYLEKENIDLSQLLNSEFNIEVSKERLKNIYFEQLTNRYSNSFKILRD